MILISCIKLSKIEYQCQKAKNKNNQLDILFCFFKIIWSSSENLIIK
jgi:hypothetical protein